MVKVLAVASGGGHWEQLMMLRDSFCQHDVHYATPERVLEHELGTISAHILPDCNMRQPLRTLPRMFCAAALTTRLRPQTVLSTTPAPRLLTTFWGRLVGARTPWHPIIGIAMRICVPGR